jgi:hypothetical protein
MVYHIGAGPISRMFETMNHSDRAVIARRPSIAQRRPPIPRRRPGRQFFFRAVPIPWSPPNLPTRRRRPPPEGGRWTSPPFFHHANRRRAICLDRLALGAPVAGAQDHNVAGGTATGRRWDATAGWWAAEGPNCAEPRRRNRGHKDGRGGEVGTGKERITVAARGAGPRGRPSGIHPSLMWTGGSGAGAATGHSQGGMNERSGKAPRPSRLREARRGRRWKRNGGSSVNGGLKEKKTPSVRAAQGGRPPRPGGEPGARAAQQGSGGGL